MFSISFYTESYRLLKNEEDFTMKKRQHIVLWSGGFDSTYMAAQLLSYPEKFGFDVKNDRLVLFSINHVNTGQNKIEKERKAREKLLPLLQQINSKVEIRTVNMNVEIEIADINYCTSGSGLIQPIFWLLSAQPMFVSGDIMYLSYIHSDDAATLFSRIKELTQKINEISKYVNEGGVEIRYPLLLLDKSEILTGLYNKNHDFLKYCISCESETDTYSCGRCWPCKHLKMALIEMLASSDKDEQDIAQEMLKLRFGITYNKTQQLTLSHILAGDYDRMEEKNESTD